jgi:hypothetical protein
MCGFEKCAKEYKPEWTMKWDDSMKERLDSSRALFAYLFPMKIFLLFLFFLMIQTCYLPIGSAA